MTKLFTFITVLFLMGCDSTSNISKKDTTTTKTTMTVSEILEKYSDTWMQVEGVIGTGEGRYQDKPCVKVFVVSSTELIKKEIPSSVDGIPVVIEVTGEIRAQ
ncbi:MAG TPA: hypothetical protein VIX80_04555 [Candidatus Kapabacteria bacterium]